MVYESVEALREDGAVSLRHAQYLAEVLENEPMSSAGAAVVRAQIEELGRNVMVCALLVGHLMRPRDVVH